MPNNFPFKCLNEPKRHQFDSIRFPRICDQQFRFQLRETLSVHFVREGERYKMELINDFRRMQFEREIRESLTSAKITLSKNP